MTDPETPVRAELLAAVGTRTHYEQTRYPKEDVVLLREIKDIDWSSMTHRYLTCRNHPTSRYLSKNPATRYLHFITPAVEAPQPGWELGGIECPCPASDLAVIVGVDGEPI